MFKLNYDDGLFSSELLVTDTQLTQSHIDFLRSLISAEQLTVSVTTENEHFKRYCFEGGEMDLTQWLNCICERGFIEQTPTRGAAWFRTTASGRAFLADITKSTLSCTIDPAMRLMAPATSK